MDPIDLPGCEHPWLVRVSATADRTALEAQLPGVLATAEKRGITTVTLAACGALPMLERSAFITLGLLSVEAQPTAGGPAIATFSDK